MRLITIINAADRVYPDNSIRRWHDGREPGDTLARFVANELEETYVEDATDQEQAEEALRAMRVAQREINDVVDAMVELVLRKKGNVLRGLFEDEIKEQLSQ